MSPSETEDLEVRSLGLCNICGQEQLLRTRALVSGSNGISVVLMHFTDCACGLQMYRSPDPASES